MCLGLLWLVCLALPSSPLRCNPSATIFLHPNTLSLLTSSSFPYLLQIPSANMPRHTHEQSRCSSAGRVTASLLLSFLALSTPIAASTNQQHKPIPILPPYLSEPQAPSPKYKDHLFVRFLAVFMPEILTEIHRHYGMSSIMETSTDRLYIGGWMCPSPKHHQLFG